MNLTTNRPLQLAIGLLFAALCAAIYARKLVPLARRSLLSPVLAALFPLYIVCFLGLITVLVVYPERLPPLGTMKPFLIIAIFGFMLMNWTADRAELSSRTGLPPRLFSRDPSTMTDAELAAAGKEWHDRMLAEKAALRRAAPDDRRAAKDLRSRIERDLKALQELRKDVVARPEGANDAEFLKQLDRQIGDLARELVEAERLVESAPRRWF